MLSPFLDICCCYMIAYQPEFLGISNVEYFNDVQRRRPQLQWKREALPPSSYLFV